MAVVVTVSSPSFKDTDVPKSDASTINNFALLHEHASLNGFVQN